MKLHAEHLSGLQHYCSSYRIFVKEGLFAPLALLWTLLQSMDNCLTAVTPCRCDPGQKYQAVALSAGQAQRLRVFA